MLQHDDSTPQKSRRCLNIYKNQWPSIEKNFLDEIKFAIQVNGKTKDIITIKKGSSQEQIEKIVKETSKAKKFIEKKKIIKTIFVKDKIINYLIK